jgi:hypothetical protein
MPLRRRTRPELILPQISNRYSRRGMRAFKFLDAQGSTVMTGHQWALPVGDGPGPWLEASATRPCHEGIHACRLDDLAYWIGPELWEIELDGEVVDSQRKVVARRGRLVRCVTAWSGSVAQELGAWSAWRTRDVAVTLLEDVGETGWAVRLRAAESLRDLARAGREAMEALEPTTVAGVAAGYAGDTAALAPTEHLAMGPFAAACAAAHSITRGGDDHAAYSQAFAQERLVQSRWIADALDLG